MFYWIPDGGLNRIPDDDLDDIPGIGIHSTVDDHLFLQQVDQALTLIYAVPTGQRLIEALIDPAVVPSVTIRRSVLGNNQCMGGGPHTASRILEAYTAYNLNQFINLIKISLHWQHVGIGLQAEADWLAHEIRNRPRYRLQGTPAFAPAMININANHILRWFTWEEMFPLPFINYGQNEPHPDEHDITNSILIITDHTQTRFPGLGSPSVVQWNPDQTFITLTPEDPNAPGDMPNIEEARPPHIGLAHELIHAYHNRYGLQLGLPEMNHHTLVLYEYKCVGLGPWHPDADAAAITENAIRLEAGQNLRPRY